MSGYLDFLTPLQRMAYEDSLVDAENKRVVDKYGRIVGAGTAETTIWRCADPAAGRTVVSFNWLTAEVKVGLSSTSANDTAAGTGARTVYIEGLNQAGAITYETVSLTGKTKAESQNKYIIIYRAWVATVGAIAGGTNDGDIYIYDTADTVAATGIPDTAAKVFNMIGKSSAASAGRHMGQTECCAYKVPAGKQLFIMDIWTSLQTGVNKDDQVLLFTRESGGAWRMKDVGNLSGDATSTDPGPHSHFGVDIVGPMGDVELRVSGTAASNVSARFDGVLIPA